MAESVPDKDRLDKALAELDNWYDNALKSGAGFKSDAERQAYVDSLGDLEKHPMFATSTEDLEGHPLVDAIRALKEEEKSRTELAIMYKDEGNDFLKKQDQPRSKNLREAYDRYTYAMKFLEQDVIDHYYDLNPTIPPTYIEHQKESIKSLPKSVVYQHLHLLLPKQQQLLSQLYSNRAVASLLLQNYGQVKQDCTTALLIWKGNCKAYVRKAKALFQLKQYQYCLEFTQLALEKLQSLDNPPSDPKEVVKTIEELQTFQQKSQEILQQAQLKQKQLYEKNWQEKKSQWLSIFQLVQALQLQLSYFSYQYPEPIQLKNVWMQYQGEHQSLLSNSTTSVETLRTHFSNPEILNQITCPLVCLYPQYNQLDVIPDANLSCMLAEYLAMIFPEPEENTTNAPAASWDTHNEYHISNLVVYLSLQASNYTITSPLEWLVTCLEYDYLFQNQSLGFFQYALLELFQSTEYQTEIESIRNYTNSSTAQLPTSRVFFTPLYQQYFHPHAISQLTSETIHKIVKVTEENLLTYQQQRSKQVAKSLKESNYAPTFYYEIPLGCTIYTLLQIVSKYQGLSRGLLSLVVLPRTSKAHRLFLQKNQKEQIPILPLQQQA